MKNEDIQSTALHLADTLLQEQGEVSLAEQVQSLLNYSADNQAQYPFATAIVNATLQYIFEAAGPEQVIL